MTAVLFVCLGNICRSPTAEAVFRKLSAEAGLDIPCDSAGTGGWHAGEPPYMPAIRAAGARGYDLTPLRARQVTAADFTRFTHILAMDRSNLHDLQAIRPAGGADPALFLNSAPGAPRRDVPDPWYTRDFDGALDLIELGCRGLIADLTA